MGTVICCSTIVYSYSLRITQDLQQSGLKEKNDSHVFAFILLLLSNRALYWFTAVGSETIFYSNKC